MEFEKILPHPSLREYIRFYWFLKARNPNPTFRKILPFGALDIIVHRGSPMFIEKDGVIEKEPWAFLEGQYLKYGEKRPSPDTDIVGISVQPWASNVLCGIPSVNFTGKIVELEHLDNNFEDLIQLIYEYKKTEIVAQKLDGYFLSMIHPNFRMECNELSEFASVLMENNEMPIEAVAKRYWGKSFRGLQMQFKETFGITLSEFRRKKRLQAAIQLMNAGVDRLTDTALSLGFYDQAHFIRTFSKFTGVTPRAYLKENSNPGETMMGELFS